jgi:hypothetical protein
MSAGAFVTTKYVANDATIHNIRVQPETLALNEALSFSVPGTASVKPQAIVSGSKRRRGVLHARTVTIMSPTPPTGYKASSSITLPILSLEVFNALPPALSPLGQPYLGDSDWVVVGTSPEKWSS